MRGGPHAGRRTSKAANGVAGPAAHLGSDTEDIDAIRAFLAKNFVHLAATVESCKAKLDAATLARWNDFAKRLVAYQSAAAPTILTATFLAQGRKLRTETNGWIKTLTDAGCGDVAKLIAEAPPPKDAPPPKGTPNPLLTLGDYLSNPWPLVVFVLLAKMSGGRSRWL
jgi:hypothetical protein